MNPIPYEELLAYRLAAIGVTADVVGVKVKRLTLQTPAPSVVLEPFEKFCGPRYEQQAVEDYLTVLLAGQIGHLLRGEVELGRNRNAGIIPKYERMISMPQLDRAYALALACLKNCDGGNPEATVRRVYGRANRLLRNGPLPERVTALASRLLSLRNLNGSEVQHFLQNESS